MDVEARIYLPEKPLENVWDMGKSRWNDYLHFKFEC